MTPHTLRWLLFGALALPIGCAPPAGLRETPAGDGPRVVADWDAEPLPEIPFPNDLALRIDETSRTGLRLNFSEEAPTELERDARREVNTMTGFGLFAPITVKFDAPLDLDVINQTMADDGNFSDDVAYVVDVTPGSPTYLQPMRLDLGHGRFPGDAFEPDKYFLNDPHADVPSILFDTHDEDIDGDGELDIGEDVDNDGVLDSPNVYPLGGDPREDLLTWYERETNTLILRPAVPLREETTYAVVLTERLLGEDGNPARSPFPHVNHTRQTDDLQPLLDALPTWDLGVDDVAFAWTFTTGNVTGDLLDVRRSLDGEGPYAWLPDEVPPAITAALPMHEVPELTNLYRLPVSRIIGILGTLGLFPEESREALLANYEFADVLVGGEFTVPWFMPDRDDGGRDTSDEYWRLDPLKGTAEYEPMKVAFTCLLPKEDADVQQPFPVGSYGHGYGSSRVEFLGFGWAFARYGIAACSFDYPGHGLDLGEDDLALAQDLLSVSGLSPILEHLEYDRARDLDNDGADNSGADQWTSDGFHTRDMVRQAAVDHLWFARALRACGTGTMGDIDGDGVEEVSCDWDADGVPDIGGPDVDLHLMGGSLGGINTALAAGVAGDTWTTIAPVVAGAGLMDVGWRSALGGVREAVVGRTTSPFVAGIPTDDGGLQVVQVVTSATRMRTIPIATLPVLTPGARVRVDNLDNGETRLGWMPQDGRFRLPFPADAPDPLEKAILAGIPESGYVEGAVYEIDDNVGLGDRFTITITDAEGNETVIDSFEADVLHEGITMRAGSPLVAGGSGLGHIRSSPRLRRIVNVLALVTEPGDPVAYARKYVQEPWEELGGQPLNILLMPTVGDEIVPVGAEINLARAAGFWDLDTVDERYDMTIDRWLIEREVVRGDERFGSFTDSAGNKILFDVDDVDGDIDQWEEPSDAPLRVSIPTASGEAGMRIPYVAPTGTHAFNFPRPDLAFDPHTHSIMQIATYADDGGQVITDDVCLADQSCAWLRPLPEEEDR